MEHAELVAPRVAHDPEVKAALLLMVIAGRAQRLQALHLGLNTGLEPGTSSLSGIEGSVLCGPAFSQVIAECHGRRDAFLANSFQAVRASQAGPQRPSGTPAFLYRPLRRPGRLMLGTKHDQTGRLWSRRHRPQRRHAENLATRPTPTQTAAAGDPDPDRGDTGGQRRMDEQRRRLTLPEWCRSPAAVGLSR